MGFWSRALETGTHREVTLLEFTDALDWLIEYRVYAPFTGHSYPNSYPTIPACQSLHPRTKHRYTLPSLKPPPTLIINKNMVSFTYLVTLSSVLVALSRAEEASSGKPQTVEDKFFFGNGFRNNLFFSSGYDLYNYNYSFYSTWSNYINGGIYGYACFPYYSFYRRYFVKANEGAQSVSRRAISLDADQLVRRADTEFVTCTAAKGVSHEFSVKDCVAASHQLAEQKTSSATVGQCTLSLVNAKEKIAAASVSAHTLEKNARQILTSCTNSVTEKEATPDDQKSLKLDNQQVVMILSKAS
ncbi:hypothetical protein MJO29_009095 [Puccinia striiformis f. sp. tritici]|nr:hypothetical protein MJO29_009095 [Puccinia striiformis f. sp. tritici]